MSTPTEPQDPEVGHYFKFERGQWLNRLGEPTKFFPAGGLTYTGLLSLEQRLELDSLISGYLHSIEIPLPEQNSTVRATLAEVVRSGQARAVILDDGRGNLSYKALNPASVQSTLPAPGNTPEDS